MLGYTYLYCIHILIFNNNKVIILRIIKVNNKNTLEFVYITLFLYILYNNNNYYWLLND